MSDAITKRQKKEKLALLERLKRLPIIQAACEKEGVGRATYYRWRRDDPEFAQQADEALSQGEAIVNDMAESQLMSAIRDKNLTAIIFWLKHHHARYATKVEVTAQLKGMSEALTPDQEALITKALHLASLIPNISSTTKEQS